MIIWFCGPCVLQGTEPFRTCRLLLMGPGRAGKTSLRKALLGQGGCREKSHGRYKQ